MKKQSHLIICIATLTIFMDMMDATVLNSALPSLSIIFQKPILILKNTLISYLASMAIFLPISGWLRERYGLRKTLFYAIVIFMMASIGCGLSKNLWVLNLFRFIQGMGAATSLPLARLLILSTFPRKDYFHQMNHVILYTTLGTLLGPFIGGIIVQFFTWQWIFWINIPLCLLNIYLLSQIKELKNKKSDFTIPFDWQGFMYSTVAILLFIIPISSLSNVNASFMINGLLLMMSFIFAYVYIHHCKNTKQSFINLKIFTYPTFKIGFYGGILSRICLGGIPFLLPLLVQILLQQEPWFSGILMIPMALGLILAKLATPTLCQYLSMNQILIYNTFAMSIFLFIFSQINFLNFNHFNFIVFMFFGVFQSLQYASLNAIAYLKIPNKLLSHATSIISLQQQLGVALGVAVCAIFLKIFSHNHEFDLKTFQLNFLFLGIISLILLLMILHYLKFEKKLSGNL